MPEGSLKVLETRHRMLQAVRGFFTSQGYLEVETPIRVKTPAMEEHIDAEPSGSWFLRTSPELHMKRLLAKGAEKIFQLGPCFRQGEQGPLHHPEFSMLEWYAVSENDQDILETTRRLLIHTAREALGTTTLTFQGNSINLEDPWAILTVREAFQTHAGWDPVSHFDPDRFDLDLVEQVEPALPKDRPVVLKDYPAPLAALSEKNTDGTASRWELYLGGLEIANAYRELTDAAEQHQRFIEWGDKRKAAGKTVYPLDKPFMDAMEQGLPPCAGIALGFDRLVMVFADVPTIAEAIGFRE